MTFLRTFVTSLDIKMKEQSVENMMKYVLYIFTSNFASDLLYRPKSTLLMFQTSSFCISMIWF